MVIVTTSIEVSPGKDPQFQESFHESAHFLSHQQGCGRIRLHRAQGNDRLYYLYIEWSNRKAFERAYQSADFQQKLKAMPITALPAMAYYDPVLEAVPHQH